MKRSPPRSKAIEPPPGLVEALEKRFNEKWPHLADREHQVKQAQKERAGLKKKDLH